MFTWRSEQRVKFLREDGEDLPHEALGLRILEICFKGLGLVSLVVPPFEDVTRFLDEPSGVGEVREGDDRVAALQGAMPGHVESAIQAAVIEELIFLCQFSRSQSEPLGLLTLLTLKSGGGTIVEPGRGFQFADDAARLECFGVFWPQDSLTEFQDNQSLRDSFVRSALGI